MPAEEKTAMDRLAGGLKELIRRVESLEVPRPPSPKENLLYVLLGVLNCLFFGIGMIIIGFLQADTNNIMVGVLQLLIPFAGWIWAVVWGAMIVHGVLA